MLYKMGEIKVKDVVVILIKDPNVIRERQHFFLELGLSQADYQQPENRYTMGTITTKDLFFELISKWMSSQEKPLLSNF